MSSNVDPDSSWVSRLGTIVYLNVAILITSAFYYGIYAILICFAVPILCNKEGRSRAKMGILVSVLTMFAISTFSVAIQAANVLLCLQILIDDDEQGMKTFRDRMYIPSGMEQALCLLTILVGDSVVIWRTWVLWSGNLKVLLAPCILLVGTTASIFAAWECMGRHLSSIDYSMDIPECVSLARVTYALSGATNVAATVAIGYKVWLHRQVARKYLATLKTRSRAEKVITLTLAFGGLYCIVLIIGMAVALPLANGSLSLQMINYLIRGGASNLGVYPTLLIVVIHLKETSWKAHSRARTLGDNALEV